MALACYAELLGGWYMQAVALFGQYGRDNHTQRAPAGSGRSACASCTLHWLACPAHLLGLHPSLTSRLPRMTGWHAGLLLSLPPCCTRLFGLCLPCTRLAWPHAPVTALLGVLRMLPDAARPAVRAGAQR